MNLWIYVLARGQKQTKNIYRITLKKIVQYSECEDLPLSYVIDDHAQ